MAEDFNFVEVDSATIYTTVIESLMEYCNEALYPGDERRIFAEGMVKVLVAVYSEFNDKMKQRTLQHARAAVLDAIGERLDVERLKPSCASAIFQFTASAVRDANIIIPSGTRITTDGSIYFETQETAILQAGSRYVNVLAVCTEGGAAHNGYTVGSVSTLVDLIPYISGAENVTESIGGDDGEPYTQEGDDRLRERIRLAPSALSTAGSESGYRYFTLSADPDIIDVAIDCPKELPTVVNIYPLMKGGELPSEETIQKVFNSVSAEKRRPMTDNVHIYAPEIVEYDIEIKYYCTKDDEPLTIQTVEGKGGSIDQYNEWQTTALDRDINPDQLRRFIFAPKTGVGALRMDVIKPTFQELKKWQTARFSGNLKVTHEVVSR